MKHRSSQGVYAHWEDKRNGAQAPERGAIDPGAMRSSLGDAFILAYNPLQGHPFRLAGTRVCALFGRELRAHAFTALWGERAAGAAAELVKFAVEDGVGVVAGVVGTSANRMHIDLELLLLPLRHGGPAHLRLIGTLAPLAAPYWLGLDRLVGLGLGEYRFLGHPPPDLSAAAGWGVSPDAPTPPLPAAPRRRGGFAVYDGGQS